MSTMVLVLATVIMLCMRSNAQGSSTSSVTPQIEADTKNIHIRVPSGGAVIIDQIGANGQIESTFNLTDIQMRLQAVESDTFFLTREVPDLQDALRLRIDDLGYKLGNLTKKTEQTDGRVSGLNTLLQNLTAALNSATEEASLMAKCQSGITNAVRAIETTPHIGDACPAGEYPHCPPFPTFNLGTAIGSGSILGSTRNIQCNEGFMTANPGHRLAVCVRSSTNTSQVEWNIDARTIRCIPAPTVSPTRSPTTSTPTQPSSWRTVYRQKNCRALNYDSDLNRGDPSNDCYSIITDVPDMNISGVWKFRLSYPQTSWIGDAKGKVPSVTWTQTSNPLVNERVSKFTVIDKGPVPGFFFNDNYPHFGFLGLSKSTSGFALMDGQDKADTWWWAIGVTGLSFPGSSTQIHDGERYKFGKCPNSQWDACWVELEVFY